MTTPLDKLDEAIAGMTDQPWTDDVSDSYGSDWHIEGPPDSNLRRRPNGGYLIAKGMRSGDAAGVVALRNAAEELIAVARAAHDLRTQLAAERSNAEVLRKLLDDVERRAEKREAQLAEVTRERDIAIRELSKWSFEAGTLKAERDELARVTAELCIKIGEANHWMRHTDAYESCIKTIAALEAKLKSAT